jgi:hypothetical protein
MKPGWLGIGLQGLAWLWAAPGSLIGLPLAMLARATGGGAVRRGRTIEAHGGLIVPVLERLGRGRTVDAMALGHVVLGRDEVSLAACRAHEQVHVRQWERWGPLFLPAYFLASVWAGLRGRDPYLANAFEREARAGERPAAIRTSDS